MAIKAPKGTKDMMPEDAYKWHYIEDAFFNICDEYGFGELRTPIFEDTNLFNRGVGETTDIVQKEMYTFKDKGDRSITLKPEGTSGAVRAFLEHGLFNEAMPQKIYYVTPCYRYEKPQAGRLREFHQFGVECFGAGSAAQDAEIILLANEVFNYLGVNNISLEINSIGCPKCRKKYQEALKEYFKANYDALCDTCKGRLEKNPMRILDCKSPVCSKIAENAPKILDYLCEDCNEHFELVKKYLTANNIDFKVNPTIVRGLDYYTRTVFEFVSNEIGAQGTVCGGGRYDGLVEEMGGKPTPACGFAFGLERLMLLMDTQKTEFPERKKCDLYIASMGEQANIKASALATDLRNEGLSAQFDTVGRSVKAQMKYADKIGALYTVVLGDSELESGRAVLKNMSDGTQAEIELADFTDNFQSIVIKQAMDSLDGYGIEGLEITDILGGQN